MNLDNAVIQDAPECERKCEASCSQSDAESTIDEDSDSEDDLCNSDCEELTEQDIQLMKMAIDKIKVTSPSACAAAVKHIKTAEADGIKAWHKNNDVNDKTSERYLPTINPWRDQGVWVVIDTACNASVHSTRWRKDFDRKIKKRTCFAGMPNKTGLHIAV